MANITNTGYWCFGGCSSLTTVRNLNGEIGNFCFRNCTSLTTVDLSNVISIGTEAFRGCSSLSTVIINSSTPPTLGSNVFQDSNNASIYVPSVNVEDYKTAWSEYASRIYAIQS